MCSIPVVSRYKFTALLQIPSTCQKTSMLVLSASTRVNLKRLGHFKLSFDTSGPSISTKYLINLCIRQM